MECDKCSGTGRLPDPPKSKITEYTHSWIDSDGGWHIYREKTLESMIKKLNKDNAPESGIKDFHGKTNWACLGIRREGSSAIVDTKYIYKIDGKWYSSGHPKVWNRK